MVLQHCAGHFGVQRHIANDRVRYVPLPAARHASERSQLGP